MNIELPVATEIFDTGLKEVKPDAILDNFSKNFPQHEKNETQEFYEFYDKYYNLYFAGFDKEIPEYGNPFINEYFKHNEDKFYIPFYTGKLPKLTGKGEELGMSITDINNYPIKIYFIGELLDGKHTGKGIKYLNGETHIFVTKLERVIITKYFTKYIKVEEGDFGIEKNTKIITKYINGTILIGTQDLLNKYIIKGTFYKCVTNSDYNLIYNGIFKENYNNGQLKLLFQGQFIENNIIYNLKSEDILNLIVTEFQNQSATLQNQSATLQNQSVPLQNRSRNVCTIC